MTGARAWLLAAVVAAGCGLVLIVGRLDELAGGEAAAVRASESSSPNGEDPREPRSKGRDGTSVPSPPLSTVSPAVLPVTLGDEAREEARAASQRLPDPILSSEDNADGVGELFQLAVRLEGRPWEDLGAWRLEARRAAEPQAPASEATGAIVTHAVASGLARTQVAIPAGSWLLRAYGTGWSTTTSAVRVGPGTDPVALTVRALARIDGRLVGAAGEPLAEQALWLAESASAAHEDAGPMVAARSASDGSFAFDEVPWGAHRLLIGHGPEPFVAPPAIQVDAPHVQLGDITVPRLGVLDVRVVDTAGVPVPGALVRCVGRERGSAEFVTDFGGEASIRALPDGELRVYARHEDFGRVNQALVFTVAGALASGEGEVLELVLGRTPN